jgi:hypothetical protein
VDRHLVDHVLIIQKQAHKIHGHDVRYNMIKIHIPGGAPLGGAPPGGPRPGGPPPPGGPLGGAPLGGPPPPGGPLGGAPRGGAPRGGPPPPGGPLGGAPRGGPPPINSNHSTTATTSDFVPQLQASSLIVTHQGDLSVGGL